MLLGGARTRSVHSHDGRRCSGSRFYYELIWLPRRLSATVASTLDMCGILSTPARFSACLINRLVSCFCVFLSFSIVTPRCCRCFSP